MTGFIYRFSLVLAIITFVTCMMNDITLFTSFIRSLMVFIVVLGLFFVGGHLLRVGVYVMKEEKKEEVAVNKQINQQDQAQEINKK
ncbi:MAG: hypothetical protein KAI81_02485 [Candidatus Marinimicrobia bacterium]|nr:hypothetical protein [Candidatus Neomarinimicrobiota bacterium]